MKHNRPKVYNRVELNYDEARDCAFNHLTQPVHPDDAKNYKIIGFDEQLFNKIFDNIDKNQKFYYLRSAEETGFLNMFITENECDDNRIQYIDYINVDVVEKDNISNVDDAVMWSLEYFKIDGHDVILLYNDSGDDSSRALVAVEYNDDAVEYDDETFFKEYNFT